MPEAGTAGKPATPGNFELRGVYLLGNEYHFLVSPAQATEGMWVRVGESHEAYEVRRWDADSETLTLYFNNSETQISLNTVEANPEPIPVAGQIRNTPKPAPRPTPAPRRIVRPTSRSSEDSAPPPAWLEKLREEASARRAQAAKSRFDTARQNSPDAAEPPRPAIPVDPEALQQLRNSMPDMGPEK